MTGLCARANVWYLSHRYNALWQPLQRNANELVPLRQQQQVGQNSRHETRRASLEIFDLFFREVDFGWFEVRSDRLAATGTKSHPLSFDQVRDSHFLSLSTEFAHDTRANTQPLTERQSLPTWPTDLTFTWHDSLLLLWLMLCRH